MGMSESSESVKTIPGKFRKLTEIDAEGKAISALRQPIAETLNVFDVSLCPKPFPKRDHGLNTTTSKFSNTDRISDIEQCMMDNLEIIREKTEDCQRLNEEIRGKIEENDRIGSEFIQYVALEELRMGTLERKATEVQLEVGKINDDHTSLVKEFGEAWEHMFCISEKLPKFSAAV